MKDSETFYSLIVIGAGSGGLAAARKAATFGAKVCIIEENKLGGTCVNLGCVPKKIMFYASDLLSRINHDSCYYSIFDKDSLENSNSPRKLEALINFETFYTHRVAAVRRLNEIFANNLAKAGVVHIDDSASLLFDESTSTCFVKTKNSNLAIRGSHILVATGSHANIPRSLPYFAHLCSSDDVFQNIKTLPKRLFIVGAGYIGVELSFMFNGLGTEVIFAIRKERVLCGFDQMIQEEVTEELHKQGVILLQYSQVQNVQNGKHVKDSGLPNEQLHLTKHKTVSVKSFDPTALAEKGVLESCLEKNRSRLSSKLTLGRDFSFVSQDGDFTELEVYDVDYVIFAIGRKPRLDCLSNHPKKAFIESKGYIPAERNYNVPELGKNVWAVGDVIGTEMLTPVAIKQGRCLAENLFNPDMLTRRGETGVYDFEGFDLKYVPSVVFSHPPVGAVGLTERKAIEVYGKENLEIKTTAFDGLFYDVPKQAGISKNNISGTKIKVVMEKASGKILGLHLKGSFADESLQGFALAVQMGVTYDDFKRCVAIHPTSAEEVVLI